jgi:hypothetical protein
MATTFTLTDGTFRSARHTTHYWGGMPLKVFERVYLDD